VAPVDWHGAEVITLTLVDTGGLEATSDLKVVVNHVDVPEPEPDKCGEVLFALETDAQVQEVLLSGTFNEWGDNAGDAELMTDDDADGTWEVLLVLDPGSYQYKFIVDGEWMADPKNPNKVDDGHGGHNSVIEVPQCPDD